MMKPSLLMLLKILLVGFFLFMIATVFIHYSEVRRTKAVISSQDDYYKKDSLAGHVHRENYNKVITWKEHSKGAFEMITNNFGFRQQNNTLADKPANTIRILVTGDSHTDGVANDDELFTAILQQQLQHFDSTKNYEVLNGGTGFYSFVNYSGFLKKFAFLKPDYFIITVYTGNDYIENVLYDESNFTFTGSLETFYARLNWRYFYSYMNNSQYAAQVMYFHLYPSKMNTSLQITYRYLDSIRNICSGQHIIPVVFFLPSVMDVDRNKANAIMIHKKFSKEDLGISQRMSEEIGLWCNQRGIINFNLLNGMKSGATSLFWSADDHLNVEGHRMVAAIMFDSLRSVMTTDR